MGGHARMNCHFWAASGRFPTVRFRSSDPRIERTHNGRTECSCDLWADRIADLPMRMPLDRIELEPVWITHADAPLLAR